jgi:hypothetical protein
VGITFSKIPARSTYLKSSWGMCSSWILVCQKNKKIPSWYNYLNLIAMVLILKFLLPIKTNIDCYGISQWHFTFVVIENCIWIIFYNFGRKKK